MRETPYSPEEQRVSDYIQEITHGTIGSGADPVGFLIASHNTLVDIVKTQISGGLLEAILTQAGSVPPTA